jgi:uncharacterized protein YbbC (DUF1343 family)
VNLDYILDAYNNTKDKALFFNTSSFTRHAGTATLQKQIEARISQEEIKKTWQNDIEKFKEIRSKYLFYN